MVDLKTYIKLGHFKDNMGLYENVKSLDEAESCAYRVLIGERFNIVFDYSYLKNHFFEVLQSNLDVTIINCDSKQDRFNEEVELTEGLVVFDHINKCSNPEVINKTKDKILIC